MVAMQRQHVPSSGVRYWVGLSLASILGCNTGDAFASVFGFVSGLPLLIAAFAAILLLERRDREPREAYYWCAIVVVRTAATNLADFVAHGIGTGPAIGVMTVVLLAALVLARSISGAVSRPVPGKIELPPTTLSYWTIMLIAGTLGTAIGDYASFRSGLGLPSASLALSAVVVVAIAIGSAGLLGIAVYYWFTIVSVRAAGTAIGDFLAKLLGLAPSTAVSGVLFIAVLSLWRARYDRSSEAAELI